MFFVYILLPNQLNCSMIYIVQNYFYLIIALFDISSPPILREIRHFLNLSLLERQPKIKNSFDFFPPFLHLNFHICFPNIGLLNYLFRHSPSYFIDEGRIRKSSKNVLKVNLLYFFSVLILLVLLMQIDIICRLFDYCHTVVHIYGTLKNLYPMLILKIYFSNLKVLALIYLCVLTTFQAGSV